MFQLSKLLAGSSKQMKQVVAKYLKIYNGELIRLRFSNVLKYVYNFKHVSRSTEVRVKYLSEQGSKMTLKKMQGHSKLEENVLQITWEH